MTKTILIVEDDELLRDLTAESLSSLYAVTITSTANADEALHHLSHEETPALVMTDIHMPGRMDGLGLAHVIWRRWPTRDFDVRTRNHRYPFTSREGGISAQTVGDYRSGLAD